MKSPKASSPTRKTRPKTIEVATGPDLTSLAATINDCHSKFVKSAASAINFAIEAGNTLLRAKDKVPHGSFQGWIAENVSFSTRTANRYMQIATKFPSVGAKETRVADFDSIRKVVAAIAKPLGKADDTDEAGNTEKADKHSNQNGDGHSHGRTESTDEADTRADDGAGSADAEEGTNDQTADQAAEDGQATETTTKDDQQHVDEEPESEPSPDEQKDPFEHLLDSQDLTDDERVLLEAINREVEELLTEVVKQARRRAKRILRTSPDSCDVEPEDVVVLIGARLKQSLDPFKQFGPVRTDEIEL